MSRRRSRSWGHGHSIAVGVAGGLMLAGHELEIISVALAAGVVIGRTWHLGRHAAARLAGRRVADTATGRPGSGAGRAERRPSAGRGFRPADSDPMYRGGDPGAGWSRVDTPYRRRFVAGVLERAGRMLRPEEELPF